MADMNLEVVERGILKAGDPGTAQRIEKLHKGQILKGDWKKVRNPQFHRKFFAMLNVGWEAWEPGEIDSKWGSAQKNFERFREEVTILAGYYEVVHSLDKTFRLIPKSISFANMDETEFEELYSSVGNVLLQRILVNWTQEQLDTYVDQVMGFL